MTPAVIVAACALAFTVASFWWLNARRGKLRSFEPHTFAGVFSEPAMLLLRFPLVLHNTGPVPLIVQNLRLRFPNEGVALPLPWRTSRVQLKPDEEDGAQMPSVFVVPGGPPRPVSSSSARPFPA